MSKIRKDLKRSEGIALLKALRKGLISEEEFKSAIVDENPSAVFIQKGSIYHLSGTDIFFMSEKEFDDHLDKEDYATIVILPGNGRETLFNGKEYINWPSRQQSPKTE